MQGSCGPLRAWAAAAICSVRALSWWSLVRAARARAAAAVGMSWVRRAAKLVLAAAQPLVLGDDSVEDLAWSELVFLAFAVGEGGGQVVNDLGIDPARDRGGG